MRLIISRAAFDAVINGQKLFRTYHRPALLNAYGPNCGQTDQAFVPAGDEFLAAHKFKACHRCFPYMKRNNHG